MRMRFGQLTLIALSIATALVNTGCVTTNLHKFRMTASEAPEVHGANTNLEKKSTSWRFTGKVNYNYEKKVNISDDIYWNKSLDELFDGNDLESGDAAYKMGGLDFTGKVDFLYKSDYFVFGLGAGYKDGLINHITFGWNFSHIEFGAFTGVYHQYSDLEYSGEVVSDGDDGDDYRTIREKDSQLNTSLFAGAYVGFYIDKFFANYSLSLYTPTPEINGKTLSVPTITSHYFTIGYRLNDWIEISAGGIITIIDVSDWGDNFGYTGGVSLYL